MRAVEIWRKIPGFSGYAISADGLIRVDAVKYHNDSQGRTKKAKVLISKSNNVCLRKDGKNHWFKRGYLILIAFVGPPPDGKYLVRHLDDNTERTILSNLAWGDHKDNHDDGVRNGKHHKAGTPGALRYAEALRGRPQPLAVRKKISATKRNNPERQSYGINGPDGRFTGRNY